MVEKIINGLYYSRTSPLLCDDFFRCCRVKRKKENKRLASVIIKIYRIYSNYRYFYSHVRMGINRNILVFSLAIGSCDCGPSGSISAGEEHEDMSAHTYNGKLSGKHPGNSC